MDWNNQNAHGTKLWINQNTYGTKLWDINTYKLVKGIT